jgi:hypothetical protein
MKSARRMILETFLVLFVSTIFLSLVASAPSASAATRHTHPSAPRNVTATAGDTAAVVKFVVPSSNGGSRITWYPLERLDQAKYETTPAKAKLQFDSTIRVWPADSAN